MTAQIRISRARPIHLVLGPFSEKLAVNEYLKVTRITDAPRIRGLIISGENGPSRGIIQ